MLEMKTFSGSGDYLYRYSYIRDRLAARQPWLVRGSLHLDRDRDHHADHSVSRLLERPSSVQVYADHLLQLPLSASRGAVHSWSLALLQLEQLPGDGQNVYDRYDQGTTILGVN